MVDSSFLLQLNEVDICPNPVLYPKMTLCVCVCVWVCGCACVYTCMYVCIYMCMHVWVCACVCVKGHDEIYWLHSINFCMFMIKFKMCVRWMDWFILMASQHVKGYFMLRC